MVEGRGSPQTSAYAREGSVHPKQPQAFAQVVVHGAGVGTAAAWLMAEVKRFARAVVMRNNRAEQKRWLASSSAGRREECIWESR